MEEQKVDTTKTISKEEFLKELEEGRAKVREKIVEDFMRDGTLPRWSNYYAVSKFKSVRRAIRKGYVDLFTGQVYPKRPFSNRKPTRGRKMNELKKQIYGLLKSKNKL
jgi:valyl-tRNA synthetase